MSTALKEAPTADQTIAISEVLLPSKLYSIEQILASTAGVGLNELRQHFGDYATGAQLVAWQERAIEKHLKIKPELAQRILRARSLSGPSLCHSSAATPAGDE